MIQLVGILNVTPDSFSDGGLYMDPAAAIAQAEKLFADGAAFVDVGAESTKPGATPLTYDEEWSRLAPILGELLQRYPGRISLDSYHTETVRRAMEVGDIVVNDITSLQDPDMFALVVTEKPRVIISHRPARNAQVAHKQEPLNDAQAVQQELLAIAERLITSGMPQEQIILDPGIGFGKTMELNWELLKFAELVPDFAVMIGHSRKRFLGEHRMETEPNLAAARIAIAHGAAYLRVHDVAAHASLV